MLLDMSKASTLFLSCQYGFVNIFVVIYFFTGPFVQNKKPLRKVYSEKYKVSECSKRAPKFLNKNKHNKSTIGTLKNVCLLYPFISPPMWIYVYIFTLTTGIVIFAGLIALLIFPSHYKKTAVLLGITGLIQIIISSLVY